MMVAIAAAAALAVFSLSPREARPETGAAIEFFTRSGCPHCARATEFLDELRRRRPELAIVKRDVGKDPAARARLRELAEARGVDRVGVPAFHVGGALIVGWRDGTTTGRDIVARLDLAAPEGAAAEEPVCPVAEDAACPPPAGPGHAVEVPILGTIDVARLGLPLFTVVLGLADGFNPCAMWVLLYLLAILAGLRRRGRMIVVAGAFVITSGVVYFAFMAAWFNVFRLVGLSRTIEVTLGIVALAMAALNLKDAVAFGRGPSLSIPAAAKPGLLGRVRRIAQAETAWAALAGAVALALVVNLVELLCTAGLPAVYGHVLAAQDLPPWEHYAYLALYNLAYILDDGIMVTIAIVTLSRRRLQEKGGRILKGLSGAIMLALALLLLLAPGWLR
jgi:glutaredoxin